MLPLTTPISRTCCLLSHHFQNLLPLTTPFPELVASYHTISRTCCFLPHHFQNLLLLATPFPELVASYHTIFQNLLPLATPSPELVASCHTILETCCLLPHHFQNLLPLTTPFPELVASCLTISRTCYLYHTFAGTCCCRFSRSLQQFVFVKAARQLSDSWESFRRALQSWIACVIVWNSPFLSLIVKVTDSQSEWQYRVIDWLAAK